MSVIAAAAYAVLMIAASGTPIYPPRAGGIYTDRRTATTWVAALISTFGLPWSGVPVAYYFGAGSWVWFACAGVSLCLLAGGGGNRRATRGFFAALNVVVIMTAIFSFMYETGVPGDIPGIEGVSAINALDGLACAELTSARALFLISAAASFLPVYSPDERASAMLSFSYSSFLAITFMPPARTLWGGLSPRDAIILDAAAYFAEALLLHTFVMGAAKYLSITPRRICWYAALNAAATAMGICLLFAAL